MKFSQVKRLTIPNGGVHRIIGKEGSLWEYDAYLCRYVSLGDSIAAGQGIREDAEYQYPKCMDWQYGTSGVTSTRIVSGNYTDLLIKKLQSKYGTNNVGYVSYARSGATNKYLRDQLNDPEVENAVANADLVTISTGANTLLETLGGDALPNFALYGAPTLVKISDDMDAGLKVISSGVDTYGSYLNIIAKIQELNQNPDAKFVIKTVHNPYKYFWAAESTKNGVPGGGSYTDGFFGPLFWAVPDIEAFGWNCREYVYKYEIEGMSLEKICKRINDPAGEGWSLADFVEQKIIMLNNVIKSVIDETRKTDKRFILADSKSVWDSYPDDHLRGHDTYSTLLNVEITRERNIEEMNWRSFWDGIFNGLSASDIINGDISGIMESLYASLAAVFVPDADPHPKENGHYVDYRTFADALGLEELSRYQITMNANFDMDNLNESSDDTVTQIVVSTGYNRSGTPIDAFTFLQPLPFVHPTAGYRFTGWNGYSDKQGIFLSSDKTIFAQWSNKYKITYRKYCGVWGVTPANETGTVDKDGSPYYLVMQVEGNTVPHLNDKFTNGNWSPTREYNATYNDSLYIQLINTGSYDLGEVHIIDASGYDQIVAGPAEYVHYTLPSKIQWDLDIEFHWQRTVGEWLEAQSYWICKIYIK